MVGESVWLIDSLRHYILLGTICKPKNYLKINRKIISVVTIPQHIPQSCQLQQWEFKHWDFRLTLWCPSTWRWDLALLSFRQSGGKVRNSTRLRESHKTWDGMREYERPMETHLYLFAFPPWITTLFFFRPFDFQCCNAVLSPGPESKLS